MGQITWGEQILDGFLNHTLKKAEELSGLEFYLNAFQTEHVLNLQDEVTYFIPLENKHASGFFYLGLSKQDLEEFAKHTLFRLSLNRTGIQQTIPMERILIEFARDLYEVPDIEHGTFEKIERFFAQEKIETDFVKFNGEVLRDCLYFELQNEEFGVCIKCKCMFYEKE